MNNVGWLLLAAVVGAAAFLAGIRMEKGRQARRVKQLNHLLERVMRGDYAADWSAFQEGEWSILAGQLELVVKRTDHMVKQLDREKGAIREFIADVSHQIKTPLTGLLTYLDLLEGGEKDPGKRKQLEKCLYLAERMHELIRTLLELARLDADAVELKMETWPGRRQRRISSSMYPPVSPCGAIGSGSSRRCLTYSSTPWITAGERSRCGWPLFRETAWCASRCSTPASCRRIRILRSCLSAFIACPAPGEGPLKEVSASDSL